MTYVYAGAPNPRGMFNSPEIEPKADRLRDLFESKVPVTTSDDGLSFTSHGSDRPLTRTKSTTNCRLSMEGASQPPPLRRN